jgi:hypothetical protein
MKPLLRPEVRRRVPGVKVVGGKMNDRTPNQLNLPSVYAVTVIGLIVIAVVVWIALMPLYSN